MTTTRRTTRSLAAIAAVSVMAICAQPAISMPDFHLEKTPRAGWTKPHSKNKNRRGKRKGKR